MPDDITAEMTLALLEVADVLRPHPQVIAYLRRAGDDGFLEGLDGLEGGAEARAALGGFLDRFGVRGVGEIDITRARWCERPTALVPLLLGHVEAGPPGAAGRRLAEGREDARFEPGDILVTTFTDPGWTASFAAIAGLVTEVGGATTHGAVVARELGLPPVVGVERATERIQDGQQIRVDGTRGYVEVVR